MAVEQVERLYARRRGRDPAAVTLYGQIRGHYPRLRNIRIERVASVEGAPASALRNVLVNELSDRLSDRSRLKPSNGPIIEIGYQRAVTDPELGSALHAAQAKGVPNLVCVKFTTRYQFDGVSPKTAKAIVKRFLLNPEVETIINPNKPWTTLMPSGIPEPMQQYDIGKMTIPELDAALKGRRLSLTTAKVRVIRNFYRALGRPATDAELEMIAAAWSDHCFHDTWKALGLFEDLRRTIAKIKHPRLVSALADNAGCWAFAYGWVLNIKGETHISPFFVSPYGAIMTLYGGVLRDISGTGQGALPILGTGVFITTDPRQPATDVAAGDLHPMFKVRESIRATGGYLNPMGVPNALARWNTHPRMVKAFALGHSVGMLPAAYAQKGVPKPGDFVICIGGATGRDGLHGAVVSSSSVTSTTAKTEGTHVQIGDPIEERKFTEVIPILRDAGCIRAITDCGAAGLSSGAGEMGEKTGIWVNLAWVLRKYSGLAKWEIWLSESQERMVLCVPPEKLRRALAILHDYNVPASILGLFTRTKRCQVVDDPSLDVSTWQASPTTELCGEVVIDLPYSFLSDCPLPKIKICEPTERPVAYIPPTPTMPNEWRDLSTRLLSSYNLCDQSGAVRRFDGTVQGRTVLTQLGGRGERMRDDLFVCHPVLGRPAVAGVANALTFSCPDVDPVGAGWLMMAQAMTRLVAAGFNPDDICCNVNVYTPRVTDSPINAWRLVQLVRYGYLPASVLLNMPVISGKDSSSGTYILPNGERIDVPLTLDVLALGYMSHVRRLIRKPFVETGRPLYLFTPGLLRKELGGSALLSLDNQLGDTLPVLDLPETRDGLDAYHRLTQSGAIVARGVVADGGLLHTLFQMSLGSGLGAEVDLGAEPLLELCGEWHAGIVFEVHRSTSDQATDRWVERTLGPQCRRIGRVTSTPTLTFTADGDRLFRVPMRTLDRAYRRTFEEVVA